MPKLVHSLANSCTFFVLCQLCSQKCLRTLWKAHTLSAPSSQCSMCPVIVREVKQFQYLPHLPSVVCVPWIAHDVKQFQYLLDRQRHFVILSVSHSRVCLCQAGDHWCDDALSDGSPRWRSGYMNIETAFRPRLLVCVRTSIACVCVCVCARAH